MTSNLTPSGRGKRVSIPDGSPAIEFPLRKSCPSGFTVADLEYIFSPDELRAFMLWMVGQTQTLCNGKRYCHQRQLYETTKCSGFPAGMPVTDEDILEGHGPVTYEWDVRRYLERGIEKEIFD